MLDTLRRLDRQLPGWTIRRRLLQRVATLPMMPAWPFVLDHTYLSQQRLHALERHLHHRLRDVPGDVMECGVAEGGSALLLALGLRTRANQGRRLWLCDTFEGLPAPTEDDPDYARAVQWTGKCRGTAEEIEALLDSYRTPRDRISFVKGLYQDTLPAMTIPPLALVHLDADWYESTMVCLTHLWPHIVPGGILQLDDYGTWQGCRKAVDEFFAGSVELHPIDQQGRWIRRPR
jgi:O-methyltransferase